MSYSTGPREKTTSRHKTGCTIVVLFVILASVILLKVILPNVILPSVILLANKVTQWENSRLIRLRLVV